MLPQAQKILPNNRERWPAAKIALVRSLHLTRGFRAYARIGYAAGLMLVMLLMLLVVACAPITTASPTDAWEYADLRSLSPPDALPSAGDFIAGYARIAGSDLQLRFDLLEIEAYFENDFYIALDYKPGGSFGLPIDGTAQIAWDSLLFLPAMGQPSLMSTFDSTQTPPGLKSATMIPRIIRNPWQDYIIISVNRYYFPDLTHGIKLQAFSTEPGAEQVRDSIGPFNTQDLPPERAPILLMLWDTLPAYTPAQALRKWDGAHTGPYGERHGLGILLENIRRYKVPAVLLDLRRPESLSALDQLGVIPLLDELQRVKLLVLPDSLPGSPTFPLFPSGLPARAPENYLAYSNQVSMNFGLQPSDFLYTPAKTKQIPGYAAYFVPRDSGPQYENQITLPPQIPSHPQATGGGLSLEIREHLVNNAIQMDKNPGSFPVLVLGGSLQSSAFGDPGAARATLSYIANHPWIEPLASHRLQFLPPSTNFQYLPGDTFPVDAGQFSPSPMLAKLPETANSNLLAAEAWVHAYSLYAPLPPEAETLPQLRAAYTGQPGILLAASQWAETPGKALNCGTDLDLDGFPECVIASQQQLAVVDPLGARLIAYFFIDDDGVHQVVAPSSQFIVGLGDSSTWNLDRIDAADPGGIHGAFADTQPPWALYNFFRIDDGFTFTSPDQLIEKSFVINNEGLSVTYETQDRVASSIPMAVDPWLRFTPAWSSKSNYSSTSEGFQISTADEILLNINSDLPLEAHSYSDSSAFLGVPENPNFNYPPGHYLPYPMTLIEFQGQGEFNFQLHPRFDSGQGEEE